MSLFSFGRKTAVPGALILPRKQVGQVNWPRCALCRRIVDAYGIENETDARIEIWARCDGAAIDPKSGQIIGLLSRVHPQMKGSTTILKGPGWSPNRFADIVSRLSFFSPDSDRQYVQNLTPDGIGKRWSAG